jgi:hypothetical protein
MTHCKLGDIARITGLPPQIIDASYRFVRCVEASEICGEPAWVLDRRVNFIVTGIGRSALSGVVFHPGDRAFFDRIQDKYLRPIRGGDLGDETRDETPTEVITSWHPKRQLEHSR